MGKGKYDYWLSGDGLLQLAAWARDGLTDEQIARKMCVASSTLSEWRKKYPQISETLQKGKEIVDIEVENALLKKALDGNTTALIFWLKNRKSEVWRDRRAESQEENDGAQDDPLSAALRKAVEDEQT